MYGRGRCAAGLLCLLVMILCACSAPSVASGRPSVTQQTRATTAGPQPAVSATSSSKTTQRHRHAPATPKRRQASPPKGNPVSVRIAGHGRTVLAADIGGPIGLSTGGIIEPRDDTVRWYQNGSWPKPGYPGPALLVGHITYLGNKGVFWKLSQTRPGDTVTVRYSSGDTAAFKVTALPQHIDKNHLPVKRIWNATVRPELRLITCDPDTPFANGHYAGNVIVYADEMIG